MKKSIKISFIFCLNLLFFSLIFAQEVNLFVKSSDIVIVDEKDSSQNVIGYHLYIKKSKNVESVMLTETTKDPLGKEPNYAYRAKEFNEINGNEKRILDGEILNSPQAKYFLIDSTVEKNQYFNQCFHIFIPTEIVFGYSWSRKGTVKIGKGTFFNIRSFEKKYCDYSGKYFDNPFMFDFKVVSKKAKKIERNKPKVDSVEVVLTDEYNPIAVHSFEEISDFLIYSKGPETIISDISESINRIESKDVVDIVFAIDATGSMKDDIEKLKHEWIPILKDDLKKINDVNLGLLFYRDYGDNFYMNNLPVKYFAFTNDVEVFVKNIKSVRIIGNEGGDIPEAVYEAIFASMEFYQWRTGSSKKVILIGDAEPHPTPRRSKRYTKELVEKMSKEKNIEINAIITPDEKAKRGR